MLEIYPKDLKIRSVGCLTLVAALLMSSSVTSCRAREKDVSDASQAHSKFGALPSSCSEIDLEQEIRSVVGPLYVTSGGNGRARDDRQSLLESIPSLSCIVSFSDRTPIDAHVSAGSPYIREILVSYQLFRDNAPGDGAKEVSKKYGDVTKANAPRRADPPSKGWEMTVIDSNLAVTVRVDGIDYPRDQAVLDSIREERYEGKLSEDDFWKALDNSSSERENDLKNAVSVLSKAVVGKIDTVPGLRVK